MKRLGFVAALAGAIAAACVPFKGAASSLRSPFGEIKGQTVDLLIMDDAGPRIIEATVQLPDAPVSVRVKLYYDESWTTVERFSEKIADYRGHYWYIGNGNSAPIEGVDCHAFALMLMVSYIPMYDQRAQIHHYGNYRVGTTMFTPMQPWKMKGPPKITSLVIHRYEPVEPEAGWLPFADHHSVRFPDRVVEKMLTPGGWIDFTDANGFPAGEFHSLTN